MWLRNTLNQQQIKLSPINRMVNIYCCGPTVYDRIHIGNVRPMIIVDLVVRTLRYQGQKLNYLHNITDIDDKIIRRAERVGMTEKTYSSPLVQAYLKHLQQLNIVFPNKIVLISDYIAEQVSFIKALVAKKATYQVKNEIFFNVKKYLDNGPLSYYQLSHFDPCRARSRIIHQQNKRYFADFALWKQTNTGVQFHSEWGMGRPGWHTECATLIDNYFQGHTIDLHVGGVDLKFPHHENERIQYVAKNNRELARVWFYVGHVQVMEQKMSKSLGNVVYLDDFLHRYSANVLRYIFYASDYHVPLQCTDQMIHEACLFDQKLSNFYHKMVLAWPAVSNFKPNPPKKFVEQVLSALNNNLNSRKVITIIYQLMKKINQQAKTKKPTTNLVAEFCLICQNLCGFTVTNAADR